MEPRQRTFRELKNIIEYLREIKGAVSIKIEDIEVVFLPKEEPQVKDIKETVKTIVNASKPNTELDVINAEVKNDPDNKKKEYDPDLFLSADGN